jgi:hypothetical protein
LVCLTFLKPTPKLKGTEETNHINHQ